jgi:hypothetical protein
MQTEQVELTLRTDVINVSSAEDRAYLLGSLRGKFCRSGGDEITVVARFPDHDKLLLETTAEVARRLVEAVRQRRLGREGILRAYICPRPPAREEELDFDRQPMVNWFSPLELVRAGTKSFLSTLFGSYADRRELQALQTAHSSAPDGESRIDEDAEEEESSEESESKDPFQLMEEKLPGRSDAVSGEVVDLSDRESIWIDYTADLGDGWNSTYTVARVLSERRLNVSDGDSSYGTERGNLLVMGGDQVYPTATREEYHNRLVGPYRSALPCVIGDEAPKLFAIPGNHDWYDGLTSFMRLFCQERWIGGWQTHQQRSYFAVKLPHDWWLWGIDVQLESDIDLPQFKYFQRLARRIKPRSKIILCTAEPGWVHLEQKGDKAYQNLEYFERKIIRANELELVVGLAGDDHMYARYEEESPGDSATKRSSGGRNTGPRQRFVAGGGGAYLSPTHQLPERINLPTGAGSATFTDANDTREAFDQQSVFPGKSDSRRMSFGALLLPFQNRSFAALLGVFYLLFAWITQSATKIPFSAGDAGNSFLEQLYRLELLTVDGLAGAVDIFWVVLRHSPATAILVVVLMGGLIAFADTNGWVKRTLLGTAHGMAHVVLALLLMATFAEINLGWAGLEIDAFGQVLLFAAEMLLVGSLLGGILFGSYLLLSNGLLRANREYQGDGRENRSEQRLKGVHANEVFATQSIADYKHFVRLRIRENGDLVIYPIGIERICREWSFNAGAVPGKSWFDPAGGDISDRASLIEKPVVVSSNAT